MDILDRHYQLIKSHYGNKIANRSKVPYINHIDEGLIILHYIDATDDAKAAFCMHPIFQIPPSLKEIDRKYLEQVDKYVLMLAMEYRNKANAYVCRPRTDGYGVEDLPVMVLPDVTAMLIADKVQNYKDFILYHSLSHPRKHELNRYFNMWLYQLGIDITYFLKLSRLITTNPQHNVVRDYCLGET